MLQLYLWIYIFKLFRLYVTQDIFLLLTYEEFSYRRIFLCQDFIK